MWPHASFLPGTGGNMLTIFSRNFAFSFSRLNSRPSSFLGIFHFVHAARSSRRVPPNASSKESTPVTMSGGRTRVFKCLNSSAFSSPWPASSAPNVLMAPWHHKTADATDHHIMDVRGAASWDGLPMSCCGGCWCVEISLSIISFAVTDKIAVAEKS